MSAASRIWVMIAALLAAAGIAPGQSVRSRVVWVKDKPRLSVELVGVAAPKELKQLAFPVSVYDGKDECIWRGQGRAAFAKDKPTAATVEWKLRAKTGPAVRVELAIDNEALKLHYAEQIHFARPGQAVRSHGLRRGGTFPDEKLTAYVCLQGAAAEDARKAQVGFVVRDADENVVLDKLLKVDLAAGETRHELDVTPPGETIGPYALEYKVENNALGWMFEASSRFAVANALVPVSSFEIDGRTWSTIAEAMDWPVDEPRVAYDDAVRRSGRRSLKIDYEPRDRKVVHGFQVLPGLPTVLRLWVKGNGSDDLLYVTFHDHYETTRSHWLRYPNTSRELVCKLDFDGWRRFGVPVLGGGLQRVSPAGSSTHIDAPIYAASLELHGRWRRTKQQPKMPRHAIWVDDLCAETQVRPAGQISLELRTDTSDCLLHKAARLFVSLGNGSGKGIEAGKLRVSAKDRARQTIFQANRDVNAGAGEFVVVEVPLGAAYDKRPLGPVDVDVSFAVPGAAGLRVAGRITLKSPHGYGLVWDFEQPETFSAMTVSRGSPMASRRPGGRCVAGGAEGSARAARIDLDPNAEGSILLHPAMPGMVDRIDVMVRGRGKPVVLRPLLMDSGLTGHTNKNFNAFFLPEIKVDWHDWRKVELVAPAVPPHYDGKRMRFMNQPYYPLNLAFLARVDCDPNDAAARKASGVLLDNIRVRTHLPAAEELRGGVVFPDETRLHAPSAPLAVALTNFAAADKRVALTWRLESYQGRVAGKGTLEVPVPAGAKVTRKLLPALPRGAYTLTLDGLGAAAVRECILAVDAGRYFGKSPRKTLAGMPELRKSLGMTAERVYLDWDNTEGVPWLHHFHWFNVVVKQATADGAYSAIPVVGFSADWATPHQQKSIAKGQYHRFIPDRIQVPVRLVDWDRFVRACAREFRGRFGRWAFWENADLASSPQGIPPKLYPKMLASFSKWVSLYDPKARIVAGGFNMDRVLDYLDALAKPADLPFHELSVQMSLGDLSPEDADVEGLLDELNELLDAHRTRKRIQLTQMDWPIGKYVTARQQAAYHARAMLLLDSRGALPHRFRFTNTGKEFQGPGIFYRVPYGNSECVQTLHRVHAPKPAYFACRHVRELLGRWRFVESATVPDFNLEANRAMLYRGPAGRLAAAVWRTVEPPRRYALPSGWAGGRAVDAFGFDVPLDKGLLCSAVPTFVFLPPACTLDTARHDLRGLAAADGKDRVALSLHLAEADSRTRARYAATGTTTRKGHYGQVPAGRKLRRPFVHGLTGEQFEFSLPAAGNAVLSRLWLLEGKGQKLTVQLNGKPAGTWDLTRSKLGASDSGVRESTFVLAGCLAGKNTVRIAYDAPGNCAAYRVEPLAGESLDLCRWGILHALQTKGRPARFRSAAGTPLAIGKVRYATGLGLHAASLIEYPLNGQFAAFEATVGVDAVTDGRGTVVFEVLVDGEKKAASKVLNGFSKPEAIKVAGLAGAGRLVLLVKDAGDGNADDLANWVDARLTLKK